MSEPLLTQEDVAMLMGVTVHAVRKWRADKRIAFVRIGQTVRFERAEVDAFIARNRQAPACTHQHAISA